MCPNGGQLDRYILAHAFCQVIDSSQRYTDFIVTQVAKQAIQKLPGGLTISKLSRDDSLKQGGAFAALAAWALIQAGAGFSGQCHMSISWQPELPYTALTLAVSCCRTMT